VIFAGEMSGNRGLLDGALNATGVTLNAFYEVQRSSTALGLVAEGLGAAVVPKLAIQKRAYPMVRSIELVEPSVSRTLVLVTRKTAQLSPAARALYDMIVEQARPAR
jgi:DNA-binding transcriptional LysR family regulator